MNETEMRELDAWIAERVLKLKRVSMLIVGPGTYAVHAGEGVTYVHVSHNHITRFVPTSGPDSLTILEKCRERVKAKCDDDHQYSVRIDCDYPFTIYQLESKFMECRFRAEAESLPLAICLFAKKLFS